MATVSPLKVSGETDQLITHAAHFLGASKKAFVDAAVREYIDNHREEIQAAANAALRQLDGSDASAVALLSGLSRAELDELGGVEES